MFKERFYQRHLILKQSDFPCFVPIHEHINDVNKKSTCPFTGKLLLITLLLVVFFSVFGNSVKKRERRKVW